MLHSRSTFPQTLNQTLTQGESDRPNRPPSFTAPARTLTPLLRPRPPLPLNERTKKGSQGRQKGLDRPEYPPHPATRIPPSPATKLALQFLSFVPLAAPATCTSQTWASPSTAKRMVSSTSPSSRLGPLMDASCTSAGT